MPVIPILQLGHPLLREVCQSVSDPAAAAPILADLRDTLHDFQRRTGWGRGISAPQIGSATRVLYLEVAGQTYQLLNPAIAATGPGRFRMWDDCFSFPDLMVWLERWTEITVEYQDETGAERQLVATDDLAELLQHEIDHLDGVLAVDRAIDGARSLATRQELVRAGRLRERPIIRSTGL